MAESIIGRHKTRIGPQPGTMEGIRRPRTSGPGMSRLAQPPQDFPDLGRIPHAEYEKNQYLQTESDQQVETQTIEPV